jgi:hypothetical protein
LRASVTSTAAYRTERDAHFSLRGDVEMTSARAVQQKCAVGRWPDLGQRIADVGARGLDCASTGQQSLASIAGLRRRNEVPGGATSYHAEFDVPVYNIGSTDSQVQDAKLVAQARQREHWQIRLCSIKPG